MPPDFTVEDMLIRNMDAIHKVLDPPIKHTCKHRPGSLAWRIDSKFPFIHFWRRRCICFCDIISVLDLSAGSPASAGDISRAVNSRYVQTWSVHSFFDDAWRTVENYTDAYRKALERT